MAENATNNIPRELQELPQWVVYKVEKNNDGKPTKIPYDAKNPHRKASSTRAKTWTDYEQAVRVGLNGRGFDGIGFVFSEEDDYAGVDLDHCVRDGKIEPWAQEYIRQLNSYAEFSPSGTGVHVIVKAVFSKEDRKKIELGGNGHPKAAIERYSSGRYFTVTGRHISGTPVMIHNRQQEIDVIFDSLLHKKENDVEFGQQRKADAQGFEGPDEELLNAARNANNGEKFSALFDRGDLSAYNGDHSAADQALVNILTFCCGPHPERIDRLFRRSALCRKKWLDREDYRNRTIDTAIKHCGKSCNRKSNQVVSQRKGEYHLTDAGNAERFSHQHGDKVRYCWTTGRWLVYDGRRWNSQKGTATANCLTIETARGILAEARGVDDKNKRRKIVEWAFQSERSAHLAAMLSIARSLPPIATYAEDFDKDNYLFNCRNGTIDLRSGKLKAHDPNDMITKLAPVHFPDEQDQASIDLWLNCLSTWHKGEQDSIDYLQRLGGMCLTGDTSSRCFPIFYGSGMNGKSVSFR